MKSSQRELVICFGGGGGGLGGGAETRDSHELWSQDLG